MERRKYLKANPSLVESDPPCSAVYLNVLASSSKEPDATICCNTKNGDSSHVSDDEKACTWMVDSSNVIAQNFRDLIPLQTNICATKVIKYVTASIAKVFFAHTSHYSIDIKCIFIGAKVTIHWSVVKISRCMVAPFVSFIFSYVLLCPGDYDYVTV